MKLKLMSAKQAVKRGFRVFRYGSRHYIPVAIDDLEFSRGGAGLDAFLPQFGGAEDGERFAQAFEDVHGKLGLPRTIYILEAMYTEQNGVEDWTVYGALELT